MQRKAYAPGRSGPAALTAATLALGLGIALTGCSPTATESADAVDSKAGPAAASAAPPGRYRTLFDPCGAVPQATLKDLLPGAAALPDAERDRTYRGTAAATFDTDRRVGCSWKSAAPDVTHLLSLDIERVVSYDPTVSDDDRAQQVYTGKQTAAGIASPPPGTTPPAGTAPATSPPASPGTPAHPASKTTVGRQPAHAPQAPAPPAGGAPSGATTAPGDETDGGLEPRPLDDLGDAAYLDDTLLTTGPSGERRLVSVVFRTSNVIVTVAYEEQTSTSPQLPDRKELQEKARNLARLLADRLEE